MIEESYEDLILMGDFNAVCDPLIDKTSKKGGGGQTSEFFF